MSLTFPKTGNPENVVGRTPWSARVPPDPLFVNTISLSNREQADEGVGRRPGGLPHKS